MSFKSTDTIQSFFQIKSRIALAPSNLNFCFAIQKFRGFRFATGRWDPSFLGNKKIWLINWSELGLTGLIADFLSNLWISSAIILSRSLVKAKGLGGLTCCGSAISSRGHPVTTCHIHGSEVTTFQFVKQNLRRPASGKESKFRIRVKATPRILLVVTLGRPGQAIGLICPCLLSSSP